MKYRSQEELRENLRWRRSAPILKQGERTHLPEIAFRQLSFIENHVKGRKEYYDPVANVAEHDCKQEGESDDSKKTRVDFLVFCCSVAIHDCLEAFSEFIGAVISWRSPVGTNFMEDGRDRCP